MLETSWVVYLMPMRNKAAMKAVCNQDEWAAKELSQPGHNILVQANIETEAEAEKVARGEPEIPAWKPKRRW